MTDGVAQAGVGAPQLLGDPVVQRGEPLDVQLVDDGVAPAAPHRRVARPSRSRRAPRRCAGRTAPSPRWSRSWGVPLDVGRTTGPVAGRDSCPTDRAGVGVEQQLVRVEAQALAGCPRPVDPVAVAVPRGDTRQRAVPDAEAELGQRRAGVSTPCSSSSNRHTQAPRWRRGRRRRSWSTPRVHVAPSGPVAARPAPALLAGGRHSRSHPPMMSLLRHLVRRTCG